MLDSPSLAIPQNQLQVDHHQELLYLFLAPRPPAAHVSPLTAVRSPGLLVGFFPPPRPSFNIPYFGEVTNKTGLRELQVSRFVEPCPLLLTCTQPPAQ